MFGSEILEIAIGVVFTFVLLSLTATTVREAAEALLKTRAIQLERGLREMLDDPTGTGITKQLFDHPLLYGLFTGNYNPAQQLTKFILPRKTVVAARDGTTTKLAQLRISFRSNLPAYIPSRNFAMALLDLASKKSDGAELSLEAARQTAVTLQNERLRRALLVAIGEAEGDIDRARTSLEAWFDGTMDRVSGWYKRETQWVLLALGLFLAIALNVDCLHVARSLALSNTLRQKIVQSAEAVKQQLPAAPPLAEGSVTQAPDGATETGTSGPTLNIPQSAVDAQLSGLSDIIGWPQFNKAVTADIENDHARTGKQLRGVKPTSAGKLNDVTNGWWATWAWRVLLSIPGWLISAFAVSLGAPFWFDVLNKLMVVRSTVKPYQKSPSEGSDDRKPGTNAANLLAPQPAKAVDAGAVAFSQTSLPDPDVQDATVAIRLAFDTGVSVSTDLKLVIDGGEPLEIPSDGQLEINVTANVPHTLYATANTAGSVLSWRDSFTPGLDDDGWPMLATLA